MNQANAVSKLDDLFYVPGRVKPNLFKLLALFFASLVVATVSDSVLAQQEQPALDIVEYQKDSVSPRKVLTGYVVDLDDRQVTLNLGTNGQRTIEVSQVLSIRLNANQSVVQARQLVLSGKFQQAITQWENVIRQEKADWLRRYAASQRCACQEAAGQKLSAVTSFLAMARQSADRVPWEVAPLAWTDQTHGPILDQQLEKWLDSKDPTQLFLAASLGLQNAKYSAASRQVMQQAAAAKDERLAALARTQLWRLESSVSPARLAEMQSELASVPRELQAGGWFLLGRFKKQAGKPKEATADFLRVATLYPDQHGLALLGLDQAYLTLNGINDPQADVVARWLKQRYPDSSAAMAIDAAAQ